VRRRPHAIARRRGGLAASVRSLAVEACTRMARTGAPLELRAPAPQPAPRTGPPWAPAPPPARPHAPLPRARRRMTSRRRVLRRRLARPRTRPRPRRRLRRLRTRFASLLCGAAAHARKIQHRRTRFSMPGWTQRAGPLRLGSRTPTMVAARTALVRPRATGAHGCLPRPAPPPPRAGCPSRPAGPARTLARRRRVRPRGRRPRPARPARPARQRRAARPAPAACLATPRCWGPP